MTLFTRADALLAPFSAMERVRPRRPDDAQLLELAGVSRHGLYRLIASGALRCEKAPALPRKDGRRGAGRVYLTLADVAAWRAARFISVNAEVGGEASAVRRRHDAQVEGTARSKRPAEPTDGRTS